MTRLPEVVDLIFVRWAQCTPFWNQIQHERFVVPISPKPMESLAVSVDAILAIVVFLFSKTILVRRLEQIRAQGGSMCYIHCLVMLTWKVKFLGPIMRKEILDNWTSTWHTEGKSSREHYYLMCLRKLITGKGHRRKVKI